MLIILGPDGAQYLISGNLVVHIPDVPDSQALQAAGIKLVSVTQPLVDALRAAAAAPAGPGTLLTHLLGTFDARLS